MNKPTKPITIYPLALVAVAGLAAQFLAARSAFDLITSNPYHSIAAALLIEAATVVEALVFVRSRNAWAALGLVLTVIVSATYNYVQAVNADAGLSSWQLIAMAVGPLAALVSVGLALGDELRRYENALMEWRLEQEAIAQEEADLLRRATLKAERAAQDEMRWQRQLEQRRLEAELERQAQLQATQLREEGLARRRAERAERKKTDTTKTRHESDRMTDAPRWRDMAHFLNDTDRPDDLKPPRIAELAQVSLRTAQRWKKMARNGKE
jgi:hypothetical protein